MNQTLPENSYPWISFSVNVIIAINYCTRIMTIAMRVGQEIYLIKYYWWRLLLTIGFMFYMCLVVSRNVAFMRHYKISHYVTNENTSLVRIWVLEDIGFQILPNWSNNKLAKDLNEIINAALIVSIGIFCIVTLFMEKAKVQKVFATNIVVRFVYCYTTMNILRPFVYLPTSLPGSASHCTNSTLTEHHKPKNVYDVFTSMAYSKNCGDLVYSGHMAGFVTGCCVVIYYTHKLFRCDHVNNHNPRTCQKWLTAWPTLGIISFCLLGMVAQALLAVGTRQHYTVDIVVGLLVGYWNFIWHLYVLRPNDMEAPSRNSPISNQGKTNYAIDEIKTLR